MYRKQIAGWAKHIDFFIIDCICLQAALFCAYFIRHEGQNLYANERYRQLAVVLFFINFTAMLVFNTFENILKRGYFKELYFTVKHVIVVGLLESLYLFLTQAGETYSRLFFLYFLIIYGGLTFMARLGWKIIVKKHFIRKEKRSLLILGEAERIEESVHCIIDRSYVAFEKIEAATIDGDLRGKSIENVPIVATAENLLEYVQHNWVDEVLVDVPVGEKYPTKIYRRLKRMGITVHTVIARNTEMTENKMQIERVGGFTVVTSSRNVATGFELFLKRAVDIAGGIVGCLICLIFIIIIGPMIKIASPGPIFFAQERIGRNGRKFKIYKFRSMYMDAEERKKELMAQNKMNGLMFKMDFDPRIIGNKITADGKQKTGLGQFIRKTSIDEFPQFWNILKGDMSLVGTRPPTLDEWEQYELHHRARMAFRPGLTGMWQASGRSEITDFEEVVKLDTQYIDEWSFGLDIKLIIKTIFAVLGHSGAV